MRSPTQTTTRFRVGMSVAAVWSFLGVAGLLSQAFLTDRGWALPAGFTVVAAGLTLMAYAMLTERVPARWRRPVLALSWAAAVLLLFVVPTNLLMRLMFLEPGGRWTLGTDVFSAVGGVCWSWAALTYQRLTGAGCSRCGRRTASPDPAASRSGDHRPVLAPSPLHRRITVGAALTPVIGFTVPHWLWALGVSFGASNADAMRATSAAALWVLGLVPLIGAGLTLGLIMSWGQLFPCWAPLVGGRRVPRWLAILPPAVVGLMLAQYGAMMTRCAGATLVTITDSCYGYGSGYFTENWAFAATYPVFLVWGSTLFAAAAGYFLTTRPPCPACGLR